jgi:hypothetical protein
MNIEYKFNEEELEGDYECPDEYTECRTTWIYTRRINKTLEEL